MYAGLRGFLSKTTFAMLYHPRMCMYSARASKEREREREPGESERKRDLFFNRVWQERTAVVKDRM